MSVVFQLFCADDLQKLDETQFRQLKEAVIAALNTSPAVLDKVKDRADTVFEQLKQRRSTQQGVRLEPNMNLVARFFNDADFNSLSQQERDIIEWAIVCEETHSPDVLQVVRDQVYPLFRQHTGGDPTGSDVFYQHNP
jgi:hypothetical protein